MDNLFPCAWRGVLIVLPPWARFAATSLLAISSTAQIHVPIALRGFNSWEQIDQILLPQFRQICQDNKNQTFESDFSSVSMAHTKPVYIAETWDVTTCAADLLRQVREWAEIKCASVPSNDLSERQTQSLALFRRNIQVHFTTIIFIY
jgi:hypothetical protein